MQVGSSVPCPDSELFVLEGSLPVQAAFNDNDFKSLDRIYEQWCTGKDRFLDGRWKLSQYGDALYQLFETWRDWPTALRMIKAWQQSPPGSNAALYAEAVYWRAYAWSGRGGGFADTVSREGWELFHERLVFAKAALIELKKRGRDCPAPYVAWLNILLESGATEEELQAVYKEGIGKYPEYQNIYFAMSRHYDPKWGGTAEKYESFASQVAEQTKEFEGMGMYARLYWLVDNKNSVPFRGEASSPPHWQKLKAGYDDLVRLYPRSFYNLGKYAGVACRSSDSELYRKLRTRIAGYEQTAAMNDPVDVCDRRHKWVERDEATPLGAGENCGLHSPPATAYRARMYGNDVAIFPVAPGSGYTGCTWYWATTASASVIEVARKFEAGQPVFSRTAIRSTQLLVTECSYSSGKLTQRATIPSTWKGDECPTAEMMRSALTEDR
jgi:hypothetical protein